GQSFEPAVLVALEDLVTGLARDIELAAQRRHLLALEQSGHESETFIHLVTLLPRHFALPQSPEVLPMSPEQTVTPVSGRAGRTRPAQCGLNFLPFFQLFHARRRSRDIRHHVSTPPCRHPSGPPHRGPA